MKEKNINESCIEQIYRLFASKLYTKDGNCQVDENGLIRMDDHEMLKDVQDVVNKRWKKLNDENLRQLTDLDGYHEEFLKLFGFGFDDVDYEADVNQALPLPSSKLQPK